MEDVDWSFYLLKSCYLIHKIGRTIAEEPFLVPGLIILGALFGVEGLLWADPIADIVAGIISLTTAAVCWKKIFKD